jgi:hypothetical protein
MSEIKAPFTPDQVESLNAFQQSRVMHPFTGNNDLLPDGQDDVLIATENGWHSLNDPDYTQDWAHHWMADWSWKQLDWRQNIKNVKENNE